MSKKVRDKKNSGAPPVIDTSGVLRFSRLSDEDRADVLNFICNGCGAKGGWIPIPHGKFFEDSCNHHDFRYWIGCREVDRLKTDWQFLEAMLDHVNDLPFRKRWIYRLWAKLYYQSVRRFGTDCFNYAPKKRDKEDLRLKIMRERRLKT